MAANRNQSHRRVAKPTPRRRLPHGDSRLEHVQRRVVEAREHFKSMPKPKAGALKGRGESTPKIRKITRLREGWTPKPGQVVKPGNRLKVGILPGEGSPQRIGPGKSADSASRRAGATPGKSEFAASRTGKPPGKPTNSGTTAKAPGLPKPPGKPSNSGTTAKIPVLHVKAAVTPTSRTSTAVKKAATKAPPRYTKKVAR